MSARKSALAASETHPPATEAILTKGGKTSKGAAIKPRGAPATKTKLPEYSTVEYAAKMKNHAASLRVAHDRRLQDIAKVAGREDINMLVAATGAQTSCPSDANKRGTLPVFPSAIRRDRGIAQQNLGDLHRPKKKDEYRNVEGKLAWAESFDDTLRKLLIDFELSADASCRLNHLDRLHAFFKEQGMSKARKPTQAPNFLVLEHPPGGTPGRWPKGSPRNIDRELSGASVLLSSTVRMKKSPQLLEAAEASRPMTVR